MSNNTAAPNLEQKLNHCLIKVYRDLVLRHLHGMSQWPFKRRVQFSFDKQQSTLYLHMLRGVWKEFYYRNDVHVVGGETMTNCGTWNKSRLWGKCLWLGYSFLFQNSIGWYFMKNPVHCISQQCKSIHMFKWRFLCSHHMPNLLFLNRNTVTKLITLLDRCNITVWNKLSYV